MTLASADDLGGSLEDGHEVGVFSRRPGVFIAAAGRGGEGSSRRRRRGTGDTGAAGDGPGRSQAAQEQVLGRVHCGGRRRIGGLRSGLRREAVESGERGLW